MNIVTMINLQVKCLRKLCNYYFLNQRLLLSGVRNVVAGNKHFCSLQNNKGSDALYLRQGSCCYNPVRTKTTKEEELSDIVWKPIYQFKYIIAARAIQRLKIFQTVFSVAVVSPAALVLLKLNMISQGEAALAFGSTVFACVMLYAVGKYSRRMVGFLYTTKTHPHLIKIAHLNFWGKRVDEITKVEDFEPLSDALLRPGDRITPLNRYSDEETLFISINYSVIHNLVEFERVFGQLPDNLREIIINNKKADIIRQRGEA